jgi:hypothetical protein
MVAYSKVYVGPSLLGRKKDEIDYEVMALFEESDKRVLSEPEGSVPVQLRHYFTELDFESGDRVVYYTMPIAAARELLELWGFTLGTAKEAFEKHAQAEVLDYRQLVGAGRPHAMHDHYRKRIELLDNLDADTWIAWIRSRDVRSPLDDLIDGDWNGYTGDDKNVPLRLALEAFPDECELIYDVTELVRADEVESDESLTSYTRSPHSKTIVLTEGRTDSWILQQAMDLLYPRLSRFFSFLDFDAFRVEGGSGRLAELVKAFAGSGIVNRVLALFDNDTAAAAAMISLKRLCLPPNIRVATLPDSALLSTYPTLGPAGSTIIDVNGIAASIELYLGRDVLSLNEGGGLLPVQWTGYERRVGKYQGEVLRKDEIHKRFKLKVQACREDKTRLLSSDWDELRLVLGTLLPAFHKPDREAILDEVLTCYVQPDRTNG